MGSTKPIANEPYVPEWFVGVVKQIVRRESIAEILSLSKDKTPEEILVSFAQEMIGLDPNHADAKLILEKYHK